MHTIFNNLLTKLDNKIVISLLLKVNNNIIILIYKLNTFHHYINYYVLYTIHF